MPPVEASDEEIDGEATDIYLPHDQKKEHRRLRRRGFPLPWLAFWFLLTVAQPPLLDVFESFSGPKAPLSNACLGQYLNVMCVDILRGGHHEDVLAPEGLQFFLTQLKRLRNGGLLWLAPPCNSWIMTSQGFYGRSHGRPIGNCKLPETLYYNRIADFVACALRAAFALGVFIILEQPLDSILFLYPPIAQALDDIGAMRVTLSLGAVGSASMKPMEFHGTSPILYTLEAIVGACQVPAKRARLTVTSGSGWTGKSDMSVSAEYPDRFCVLVAKLLAKHKQELIHAIPTCSVFSAQRVKAPWAKAMLCDQFLE